MLVVVACPNAVHDARARDAGSREGKVFSPVATRDRSAADQGRPLRRLVIVESPTKARKIAPYLGRNYTVEASVGHIRDLPRGAADVPAKYKGQPWRSEEHTSELQSREK